MHNMYILLSTTYFEAFSISSFYASWAFVMCVCGDHFYIYHYNFPYFFPSYIHPFCSFSPFTTIFILKKYIYLRVLWISLLLFAQTFHVVIISSTPRCSKAIKEYYTKFYNDIAILAKPYMSTDNIIKYIILNIHAQMKWL